MSSRPNTVQKVEALRGYQVEVLGHVRERMTDEGDPVTPDEMRAFQSKIDALMQDFQEKGDLNKSATLNGIAVDAVQIPQI